MSGLFPLRGLFLLLAGTLACGGLGPRAAPPAPDLEIREAGRFNFRGGASEDPNLSAEEISGLVRIEDDLYAAVSDEHAALHFVRIRVDPVTGRVASAAFERAVPLTDVSGAPDRRGLDREAVGYDPSSETVWIAEESVPSLRRHALDGRGIEVVDPVSEPGLAAFAERRPNLGFEALTRRPEGGGWWVANEEALEIDGPAASPGSGSVVRLVALDTSMRPTAAYAYATDPVPGPIASPTPAVGHELSGVVGLVALPGGPLLVFERALGGDASGMARFRIRVYAVDVEGATDLSGLGPGGLAEARYRPVAKRLLYESLHGLLVSNFEAFAAGPTLDGGARSLLLFADNGGGTWQSILALRLEAGGSR